MHKPLLFTLLLFGFIVMAIAQAPSISVQKLMTASEFEAAGMHKLSREELQTLDSWLVKTLMEVAQRSRAASQPLGVGSTVSGTYPVESSVNDETFIINGEVFKAKTYCFNVNKGDRVKFVEGSSNGACASARFVNMRTGNACAVWCE